MLEMTVITVICWPSIKISLVDGSVIWRPPLIHSGDRGLHCKIVLVDVSVIDFGSGHCHFSEGTVTWWPSLSLYCIALTFSGRHCHLLSFYRSLPRF